MAAGQVLARDAEVAVGRGAVGEDDRVVALAQLVDRCMSLPTSTLPKKRNPGRAAVFS